MVGDLKLLTKTNARWIHQNSVKIIQLILIVNKLPGYRIDRSMTFFIYFISVVNKAYFYLDQGWNSHIFGAMPPTRSTGTWYDSYTWSLFNLVICVLSTNVIKDFKMMTIFFKKCDKANLYLLHIVNWSKLTELYGSTWRTQDRYGTWNNVEIRGEFNLYEEWLVKKALGDIGNSRDGGRKINTIKYTNDLTVLSKAIYWMKS